MRLHRNEATPARLLHISIGSNCNERTTSWFALTKKCSQCVYLYSYKYATIMFLFLLPWCLALYPSCGPTQRERKPLQSNRLGHMYVGV